MRKQGDAVSVCRIWLDAWHDVLGLFDKGGIQSIQAFDERFCGTQSLFNWIQDLQDELWCAEVTDRQFLTARIALCEECLRRFPSDNYLIESWRRALAESCFEFGEPGKAETLYRDWLKADPRWGWGWIGWSDCYRFTHTEWKDSSRAERILREGMAIADVRNHSDLVDRLADLYREQGRQKEPRQLRQEEKVGRNQPCPCGSGKKFKKCCLGKLE